MTNHLTPITPLPHGDEADNGTLAIQIKLWDFMGKQVKRYTSGESSSIPQELAQELFSSVCFTLGIDLNGNPEDLNWILDADLDQRFKEGIADIAQKTQLGKRLWQAACLGVPQLHSISLYDTLKSVGEFFRHYDYYYLAHDMPCDIDYQLCLPVGANLLGIDFINEYLKRIIIENELLGCFPSELCISLLDAYCPDYSGLLINLYEPVATNVIGLSLIGGEVHKLDISDSDRELITELLSPLPEEALIERLRSAASSACVSLGITKLPARHYLRKLAAALYPRIDAALSAGGLDGIFLSTSD